MDNAALISILRIILAIYTVDLQFQAMIFVGEISSSHSPLQQMWCKVFDDMKEKTVVSWTVLLESVVSGQV
ncbi:hypothetical protein LguiB_013302 [Lonicera macranthoides]